MNKQVKADLFRYGGLESLTKGLKEPGFRYMYFFRKANKYKTTLLLGTFLKLIMRRLGYKYGFQIPITTTIGKGFYIGHFGTIVINGAATIGENCNIAHNVTIGQANRGKSKGVPTIGNKVWMGTGSVIVGKITVGNNVLIAPNSFVNADVPDNSLVIGNPAKIIEKEDPTKDYINFVLKP